MSKSVGRMKRPALIVVALSVMLLSMSSCISTKTRMLSERDMSNVKVIGTVEDEYTSFYIYYYYIRFIWLDRWVQKKANMILRADARKQYKLDYDEFDIVNVQAKYRFEWWHIPSNIGLYFALGSNVAIRGDVVCKSVKCGAEGADVKIERSQEATERLELALGMSKKFENAFISASTKLMERLPNNAKVAIMDMDSDDKKMAKYMYNEMEYMFGTLGSFDMIGRKDLDLVLGERNLQSSEMFDEGTRVNLKKSIGVEYMITATATANRVVVKALDVEAGKVKFMMSETF